MRDNAISVTAWASRSLLAGRDRCGDRDGVEGIHQCVCVVADATGEFTAISGPHLYAGNPPSGLGIVHSTE